MNKLFIDPLKLVQYRARARLTQSELAEKLGTNTSRIGKYESGMQNPRKTMIFQMADVFNIEFTDLLKESANA